MPKKNLGLVVAIIAIAACGWLLFSFISKSIHEQKNSPTEASHSLRLHAGGVLQLPVGWQVAAGVTNSQFTNHTVSFSGGQIGISDINVEAWLKGPDPDEGYVITHADRPAALRVLQDIFSRQAITLVDQTAFEKSAGEFLGYANKYRVALRYIASSDNTFRGITFFNLQGQDVGVGPLYYVTLYNPDSNKIISGYFDPRTGVSSAPKEIIEVNASLQKIEWGKTSDEEVERLDLTAHEQFKKILETTPRNQLSFGASLDAVDSFFRSVH